MPTLNFRLVGHTFNSLALILDQHSTHNQIQSTGTATRNQPANHCFSAMMSSSVVNNRALCRLTSNPPWPNVHVDPTLRRRGRRLLGVALVALSMPSVGKETNAWLVRLDVELHAPIVDVSHIIRHSQQWCPTYFTSSFGFGGVNLLNGATDFYLTCRWYTRFRALRAGALWFLKRSVYCVSVAF